MLAALQRTRSLLLESARKHQLYAPPPTAPSGPSFAVNSLPLPLVEPLWPQLIALGGRDVHARQIPSSLDQATQRLRDVCQDDYRRRQQSIRTLFQDLKGLSRVHKTYCTIYTTTLKQWTSYVLNDFVPRLLATRNSHRETRSTSSTQSRRPFNHVSLPMLRCNRRSYHFQEGRPYSLTVF